MKSTTLIFGSLLILLLLLPTTTIKAQEVEDEREFDYGKGGKKGPKHWGEIKKEWEKCNQGEMQSPIDMSSQRVEIIPRSEELKKHYKPCNATVINRGHDIVANAILARAIAPLARSTKREVQLRTDVELLQAELSGRNSELKRERDLHADTRNKVSQANRRIGELEEQNSLLQHEFVGLNDHAKKLVQDKELLVEENRTLVGNLQVIEGKFAGVHAQLSNLIHANNTLMAEQAIIKQAAIREYEESPALTDKIMTQFAEDVEAYREKARAKLVDAGLDASILDSSDEESEAEADAGSP